MELLLAISPIAIVIIGVVGLKKPATIVSVISLIYTIFLGMLYFHMENSVIIAQTTNGMIEGAKMVFMIWSAFLVLNLLINTGAMDKIKEIIADLTVDRRKQFIIIAFCFGGFLEGVAGAGTPAAIAAPFLVALGIPPLSAVVGALVFNGIAASLGAAGLTTIGGFAAFVSTNPPIVDVMEVSSYTSFLHFFGALIAPILVLVILWGRKAIDKGIVKFALVTGFAYGGCMVLVATFVGAEFPTICAGLGSLVVSILYIKLFCKNEVVPEEHRYVPDPTKPRSTMPAYKALSAYGILLVALPTVRFFAPDWFIGLGFAVWIGITITCVCLVSAVILKDIPAMPKHMKEAFLSVFGALIAMAALVALSNLMKSGGLLSIIAKALADILGPVYPAVAVIIGSLGSFVAGTTTGSNILFAPMHYEACNILGFNVPVVFAAQNAGGALGNMICTNNVVAVCATVGFRGQEGEIMRKVFKPICVLWVAYCALALLYAYVLFPLK